MTFIYSREGEEIKCRLCGKVQKCMNVIKESDGSWSSECRICFKESMEGIKQSKYPKIKEAIDKGLKDFLKNNKEQMKAFENGELVGPDALAITRIKDIDIQLKKEYGDKND